MILIITDLTGVVDDTSSLVENQTATESKTVRA